MPPEYILEFINHFFALCDVLATQFRRVLLYPAVPVERIFLLYLLTSTLLALSVYKKSKAATTAAGEGESFLRFLFPARVWNSASAWLDVRYFFFHQMVRLVIYGAFMSAVIAATLHYSFQWANWIRAGDPPVSPAYHLPVEILYVLLAIVLVDFLAWVIHYLQHKVPLLWEFHKVHHAPEVMHPLTNYREHPVDNILYATGTGACIGGLAGAVSSVVGYVPSIPTLIGVNFATFLFNFMGYNLRHSHIWLKWPGLLNYVFGSPAHHQVHHSCHPDHINRNFAFMFPLWDVVFGTFCIPADNKDVKFGLSPDQQDDYRSCLDIYLRPVRKIGRNILSWREKPAVQ